MELNTNSDAQAQIEVQINKPGRILHFSDGVDEEVVEETVSDLGTQLSSEDKIDPKSLTWGPWFSHYASLSGTKVLNAVDYAGESLANFFGITTPKYQIEIDEYERLQAEKKKMEEEHVGWVPKNVGGDIPLVLNEPLNVNKPAEV